MVANVIDAENLTKNFANMIAVDKVSFKVEKVLPLIGDGKQDKYPPSLTFWGMRPLLYLKLLRLTSSNYGG